MSTIPACATATGEGGSESFFFFFSPPPRFNYVARRVEPGGDPLLTAAFFHRGADATCRFPQGEFGNAARLRTGVTSFPRILPEPRGGDLIG